MRLSTITNLAYAVTLMLTTVSGAASILSATSAAQERTAIQNHLDLDDVAEELAIVAQSRTDEARLYVMRGDEQHLATFFVNEDKERQLGSVLGKLENNGVSAAERTLFEKIRINADTLDKIEKEAIAAYRAGRPDAAQRALFGDAHYRLHTGLLESVTQLRTSVAARSQAAVDAAKNRSDFYGSIAKTMLGLTALMFLAVLYFVLSRRVAIPLIRMSKVVTRLARQDYNVDVPDDGRHDEIGEMSQAIQIFRDNGLERDRLDAERLKDRRMKDLILQMMHRVQACQNLDELADAVSRYMPQIFPTVAGLLFVHQENSSALTSAGQWSDPAFSDVKFAIDDCWALRRGRPHISGQNRDDVTCHHIHNPTGNSLCIPLTALGEIVGLFYLENSSLDGFLDGERIYIELLAENVGLAVANLQLRQRLTNMAKRDALTGLLNRRSLDEALNKQVEQPTTALACLMIDIDYFKRFNDKFGHDAGDAVMQYVARILSEATTGLGEVFRFGGEEFTVLMSGAKLDDAVQARKDCVDQLSALPSPTAAVSSIPLQSLLALQRHRMPEL